MAAKTRLTVTAAASPATLTTLEHIKTLIPIDSDYDTAAAGLLSAASSSIARRLGYVPAADGTVTAARETVSEEWRHITCAARLILGRWPIGIITSVTVDGVVLDAALYEADEPRGFLYRLDESGDRTIWEGDRITVVYSGGWIVKPTNQQTLPADLELAAARLTFRLLQQNYEGEFDTIKSESFPGIGSWQFATEAVTWENGVSSDVAPGLALYARKHYLRS